MLDVMRLRNLGDNQVILRRQLDTNLAAQWASLVAQMVKTLLAMWGHSHPRGKFWEKGYIIGHGSETVALKN